jgi:hypothetical protein
MTSLSIGRFSFRICSSYAELKVYLFQKIRIIIKDIWKEFSSVVFKLRTIHKKMKFILYAFRVTIGTYTVLNRSIWTGISTRFNMEHKNAFIWTKYVIKDIIIPHILKLRTYRKFKFIFRYKTYISKKSSLLWFSNLGQYIRKWSSSSTLLELQLEHIRFSTGVIMYYLIIFVNLNVQWLSFL